MLKPVYLRLFFCQAALLLLAACLRPIAPLPAVAPQCDDVSASVATDATGTVILITNPSGIGAADVLQQGGAWPQPLYVRFSLAGMERLQWSWPGVTIEAALSSLDGRTVRAEVRLDGGEAQLIGPHSPYWPAMRVRSDTGAGSQPFVEVTAPPALYAAGPPAFRLEWIDFYR